jgi:hypothetical protein
MTELIIKLDDTEPHEPMGYWVDLSGIKFDDLASDEGDAVKWLQAMPMGTYQHPTFGEIPINATTVAEFADNVTNNVRGQELDIDYDHKALTGDAAGWVKGAQARPDGLWLGIQFTKSALAKLKEKAYRYFSPEFTREWTHPSTGVVHKNVLFGGALTNRPFLKGILPINLSEVIPENSGEYMLEELRKLLGLPDTATEAEVLAAANTRLELPDPNEGGNGNQGEGAKGTVGDKKPEGTPDPEGGKKDEPIAASEDVIKLHERIALLEAAAKLSDVTVRLSDLKEVKNGKVALTPAGIDQLKALALDAPSGDYQDKLFKFAESVMTTGVVELGERAGNRNDGQNNANSEGQQFIKLTEDYATEHKVSFREAAEAVSMAEPDLFSAYQNESYVRTKGDAN